MAPGSLKECHIVVLGGTSFRADYTPSNLKKWIESAGGHVAFKEKLTEQTTHVVMSEDAWLDQGPFVQEILQSEIKNAPEQKARVINIVSYEWLQECLDTRTKKGESGYKWKNLAKDVLKNAGRASKQQAKERKQPGNTQGLVAEAFLDATEEFVDAGEQKRIIKRKRQEALDRAEEEEDEKRQFEIYRKKMSVPEQAAVFRKGAKRARNDILSDNHHIYVDSTGFAFDVPITKVDFNNNANERHVLTIYETNSEPHSYAFNCSFAGTKALARNDIIAAIGSNFPTTFRAFKKVFKEKTRVDWDNRILEFNQREANARLNAGKEEPAFEKLPFEYYPPKYGPLGELPLVQMEAMTAAAQAAQAEKGFRPSQVVDGWKMSDDGEDGTRNASPSFKKYAASAAKASGFPPGDELNGSPFDYPFERVGGGKDDAIVLDDDSDVEEATPQVAVDKKKKSSTDPATSATQQVEEQSYQELPETYEFDDALDLTQTIGFSEMETQAFAQTQLAEAALEDLLSGKQTQLLSGELEEQGVTARPDDVNAEATTTLKDPEARSTQGKSHGKGGNGGGTVDFGLELI